MSNCVKVSVKAPRVLQVVTCNTHDQNVRLDTPSNKDLEEPIHAPHIFNLIELSDAGSDPTATGGKLFVLQSELTKVYLGLTLNRQLLARTTQFPPPDSFRFRFQSDSGYGYLDVGVPAHIVAADGEPVNDPNSPNRALLLFVQSLQPKAQPYSIEDSWKQQSSVVSAIGGIGVDDDAPIYDNDSPEVELLSKGGGTNLDNSHELSMVAELRKTGELEDAIDVLSEEKYDGKMPPASTFPSHRRDRDTQSDTKVFQRHPPMLPWIREMCGESIQGVVHHGSMHVHEVRAYPDLFSI